MDDSAPAPSHSGTVPAQAVVASPRMAESRTDSAAAQPAVPQIGVARADAVQPIPYRTDADGTAASTAGALLVAVLLLAALAFALRLAKRRGLLDRWIVAAPGRVADRTQMQVVHALRVSPKTTLYRIRDADRHYLLVESLAQTTLTPLSGGDAPTGTDDEHDDAR